MKYGADGRISRSYLPYVASTTTGTYQEDYSVAQSSFGDPSDNMADDLKPYAESIFEKSPLGRTVEVGGAGAAWQPGSGHAATASYTFNDT